jgi:hypothetical protein
MLLLHQDVFGPGEVRHVPELYVVVGNGFVVGFLQRKEQVKLDVVVYSYEQNS